MKGWKEVKLKDVTSKLGDGLHGTPKYDNNGEYYFVNGNNLQNGKIIIKEDTKRITKAEYLKIKKQLNDRTILVAINGTLGNIGLYRGEKIALGKSACYFNVNQDVEKQFIRYVIESPLFQMYAQLFATGATIKNLSLKEMRNFSFHLPPLPTQRKIAKILSAYDNLIENNLKRIKLLEEMAQIEFNNWYAENKDFEEVNLGSLIGHEIGGGWGAEEKSEEFSEPAYVIRGTDIDELPNGKVEKVPFRYHKKSNLASRNLQDGDIIFEVSGGSSYEGVAKTLLVTDELLKQFDNAAMPASFCKLARPIERKYSNFLFLFWRFLRNIKGTEVFEIRSASNIVNYNWTAFLKFQQIKNV